MARPVKLHKYSNGSGPLLGDICPAGAYCVAGSSAPTLCAPGTFSASIGNANVSQCLPCLAGSYCPDAGTVTPRSCLGGFYCPQGTTFPTILCPTGHECDAGSAVPLSCPAGTYQDRVGNATCQSCPTGKVCISNTTMPADCPPGSYCPLGTRYNSEFLCPNGTYSATVGLHSASQCTPCTPGMFCGSPGLTAPTGPCSAGYFCRGGSAVATPYHSGSSAASQISSYFGDSCASPANSSLNDVCPPGHYCPASSPSPIQCPAGRNSSSVGLKSVTDCPPCLKGFYCPHNGTVLATRACLPGYYCPSGTSNPTADASLLCPTGSECPVGSATPVACAAGTYQDQAGNETCKTCPAGKFCVSGTTSPADCPPGSYCPLGTRYNSEFLCPNGTYSATVGLHSASQCTPCTPGMFCGSPGLTAPTGPCSAGYFCRGGSAVATPYHSGSSAASQISSYFGDSCASPANSSLNDVCPPGHYCPASSPSPIQCPAGRNSSSVGLKSVTDCPPCLKGFYCPHNGTVLATRACLPGYYCPSGTSNPTADASLLCPTGSECPVGSAVPTACVEATFMNHTGAAHCDVCPAGFYCNPAVSTIVPLACPRGYYCPAGTGLNWQKCPVGTYGGRVNLGSVGECAVCDGGMYCSVEGLPSPDGFCRAGFYCPAGSRNDVGLTSQSQNHTCPIGSYCPRGSVVPAGCPPGTFNPSRGKHNVTECLDCTPGSFCGLWNMSSPSGPCEAGFFCSTGSNVSNPVSMYENGYTSRMVGGGVCPVGHSCPSGTAVPYSCPPGTFNDLIEQSSCRVCPASYFCPGSVSNYASGAYDCPKGFYCKNGTQVATQHPCPAGTYSNRTLLRSISECIAAPGGHYSQGTGNDRPTGLCATGYYCPAGATTATPSCSSKYCSTGGACVAGEECAQGSHLPVPCRAGHYCGDQSGLVTGVCAAGYYCIQVCEVFDLYPLLSKTILLDVNVRLLT